MILKKYAIFVALTMSVSLYTNEQDDKDTAKNCGLVAGAATFFYCISKGKIIVAPICGVLTAYGVRAGTEIVLRDDQEIGNINIKRVASTAVDVAADVVKEAAAFGVRIIKKVTTPGRDSE